VVRENQVLIIGRVRCLARYGFASEIAPGQWQVGGATWLDRELASDKRTALGAAGFGLEVRDAQQRAARLVDMGLASPRTPGHSITTSRSTIRTLERREIDCARRWQPSEDWSTARANRVSS